MKSIKIQIQKLGNDLMIKIPDVISEMMDWRENDMLEVPFHEFTKVPNNPESTTNLTGNEEIIVKIGNHPERLITRQDVIQKLENPKLDYNIYRTAYLIWKNKRFGVKSVCKDLFGFNDFNTVTGEAYLRKLGFSTFRVGKS